MKNWLYFLKKPTAAGPTPPCELTRSVKPCGLGTFVSVIVKSSHLAVNAPYICPAVLTGPSLCIDLSSDLFTCRQVSFTHFPLRSLAKENGPSDTQRGPGLVKGASVEDCLEKGVHRAR